MDFEGIEKALCYDRDWLCEDGWVWVQFYGHHLYDLEDI